jgi:sigma-E factor negative regulatory protein RseB
VRLEPTAADPSGRVVEQRDRLDAVLGFDAAVLDLLARNYDADVVGPDSVAGRRADLVVVRRPNGAPVGRFWVDRSTGLLLRRELLDADGRMLRESAFLSLALRRPFMSQQRGVQVGATGVAVRPVQLDAVRRDGWVLPRTLPGGLALFDLRLGSAGEDGPLHLTYVDGVSTLSLFEQRGRLDTSALSGWHRARVGGHVVFLQSGFPRRVVWAGGGMVFTLVADCQQAVLEGMVAALPHEQRHRGFWERLWHGLCRVGSWLNPFD